MSSYRKNIIVGVTVLGGLFALAWMMLAFGELPAHLFAEKRFPVKFVTDRADGLATGSPIVFRGVSVGRVTAVNLSEDYKLVVIDAEVESGRTLPANLRGVIRAQGLIGSASSIVLELADPIPVGVLKEDAPPIQTRFAGLDLLPAGSDQALTEIRKMSEQIRLTLETVRDEKVVANLNETITAIRTQVEAAGKTIEALNSVTADGGLQQNLKDAAANLKAATDSAVRVTGNLDGLTTDARKDLGNLNEKISARLEQVAKLLEGFNSITTKIDKGQGTAGQLVNDPKLYEALVASTQELHATIADLRRLVEQWEQEGVSLKLK